MAWKPPRPSEARVRRPCLSWLLLCGSLCAAPTVAGPAGNSSGSVAAEESYGKAYATRQCDSDRHRRRLAGAAPPWWCKASERDFVEACAAAVMVVITLGFELLFHHLQHKATHSYVYGDRMLSKTQKAAHRGALVFGKPLYEALQENVGSEIMVLGFLSFTVWSCNQAGFFGYLASVRFNVTTPTVDADYLHLVEAVHIQLFLAMVFYFLLGFRVVRGASRRNKELETLREEWIEQLRGKRAGDVEHDSRALRTFKAWRAHYLTWVVGKVSCWRVERPESFERVTEALGLADQGTEVTAEDLHVSLQRSFSFATYLAFANRESTLDIITLSSVELLAIVVIKSLLAVVYTTMGIAEIDIAPYFVLVAVVPIVVILVVTATMRVILNGRDKQAAIEGRGCRRLDAMGRFSRILEAASQNERWREKINIHDIVLQLWQCGLFFVSFAFAGFLISSGTYDDLRRRDSRTIFQVCMYLAFFLSTFFVLPKAVPDFATVMALPPFFNHTNRELMILALTSGGAPCAGWAGPQADEAGSRTAESRGRAELLRAVRNLVEMNKRGGKARSAAANADNTAPGSSGRPLVVLGPGTGEEVQTLTRVESMVVDDLFEILTEWAKEEGQRPPPSAKPPAGTESSAIQRRLSVIHEALQQGKSEVRRRTQHQVTINVDDVDLERPPVKVDEEDETTAGSSSGSSPTGIRGAPPSRTPCHDVAIDVESGVPARPPAEGVTSVDEAVLARFVKKKPAAPTKASERRRAPGGPPQARPTRASSRGLQ